jgi:hypothetical protein
MFSRLTQSAGKNKEGEEASGTITIPEVAHDTEEDEYVVRSLRSHPLTCSLLSSSMHTDLLEV